MNDPIKQAENLHAEANQLLEDTSLLELLQEYGSVYPTGSYHYKLMTWRDIDFCLAVKELQPDIVLNIANRVSVIPHVGSMYYRNELVMKTEGNPRAIFLCVDFYLFKDVKWKIDILVSDFDEVNRVLNRGKTLMARLTPEIRKAILIIKNDVCQRAEYRFNFNSEMVYNAVLEHGIRTVNEWDTWYRQREAQPPA